MGQDGGREEGLYFVFVMEVAVAASGLSAGFPYTGILDSLHGSRMGNEVGERRDGTPNDSMASD